MVRTGTKWLHDRLAEGVPRANPQSFNNVEIIRSESDLPPAEGGVRTLEDSTPYLFDDIVTSDDTLEVGYMTPLVGWQGGSSGFLHTGGATAIQCDDEVFFQQDMFVHAPGGTIYDLSATNERDMLVVSVSAADPGGFGNAASVGTVDGFRVPVFEFCSFDDADDGVTFTGDSDKIFVTGCPFRNMGDGASAITIASECTTDYLDISGGFFVDFGANTVGIDVEDPASVSGSGILSQNVMGPSVDEKVRGIDNTTVGWRFRDNIGLQNSAIRGGLVLTEEVTVAISQQASSKTDEAAFETISGTTDPNPSQSRIEITTGAELEYTGQFTADLMAAVTTTLSGTQDEIAVGIFQNGSLVSQSAFGSTLSGSSPATITTTSALTADMGDMFTVRVANLGSTSDITVEDMNISMTD